MKRVLIISQSEEAAKLLHGFIRENFGTGISAAKSASEADELLSSYVYGLVIINTPLADMPEQEMAHRIIQTTDSAVMIILKKEEHSAEHIKSLESDGIVVIDKPVSKSAFLSAISVIDIMQNRVNTIIHENGDLREKLTEQRIVARAKCTLMQYLGLSEVAAHKHIEKQAMDLRMTRRQVAENILRTYE